MKQVLSSHMGMKNKNAKDLLLIQLGYNKLLSLRCYTADEEKKENEK